jgi:regulator of sigma E protease
MSWVITILGIAALILLHELGHFIVAKAVGMRVERFSLFFPPTIARIKLGETEYALGALPLGGYVKITGMSPEELEPKAAPALAVALPGAAMSHSREQEAAEQPVDPEILRRAYYNQPPWKRIVVILAGPGVNILIAFVLFWAVIYSGDFTGAIALSDLNPSVQTLAANTKVLEVERGKPADGVLRPGDQIIAVDGKHVRSPEAIQRLVAAHVCSGTLAENCRAASPVALTVIRDRRDVSLSVYPRYQAKLKRMLVGFDFGYTAKPAGLLAATGTTLHEMWSASVSLVSNIGHAFTSAKVRSQLHSVVGITEIAHETVVAGPGYALVFLGFISLILAVVNLFPFLPLDGGHILWSVAEKIRGRRISLTTMWRISSVGILALAFLVINGFGNDIGRLGG